MADKNKLTKRQRQILDYIQSFIEKKHYPPSVRDIGQALGLSSPSTVHAHLNALERKGYIKREASKSRSVALTQSAHKLTDSPCVVSKDHVMGIEMLPLVGRVAAGVPILAEQNIEEEIPVPKTMFGDRNSFLLTVHGDSMIEAGILDGDVVLVREEQSAENGDIVVALIEDSATVKTYYREKDCVRLQPQNPTMEPIFTRNVQILGIVTGLFRRF